MYCFTGSNIHVDTDGATGSARIIQGGAEKADSSYRFSRIRMYLEALQFLVLLMKQQIDFQIVGEKAEELQLENDRIFRLSS